MSNNNKLKILGISGSLRAASFNSGLIAAAKELSIPGIEIEIYNDISRLPIFSEELEGANRPQLATELDRAIRSADAVLIATPEYSGSLPGGLKNLLDWGSRPHGQSAFAHKPTAVIGASAGQFGAAWSVNATSEILSHIGENVLETHMTVGGSHGKFDSNGVLQDEVTRTSLSGLIKELVQIAPIEAAA